MYDFILLKLNLGRSIINISITKDMNMIIRYRPVLKLLMLAVVTGIISQLVLIPWSQIAQAETEANISWTDNPPVTYSSTNVSEMPSNYCRYSYQTKEVSGYPGLKNICIASGENVRFSSYYEANGSNFLAAVGFRFDTKMYRVNGICGQYDNCLYLPGSDTLVTKQHLINGIVRSLVVYKNFTSRLTPVINTNIISTLEYNFDASNPDLTFQSADGYAWPVGGVGASDNGDWLAVEFRQRGIGLLNIHTLNMRRISLLSFYYNSGMNPTSELVVSNDGNHVAVAGINSGFNVIDVNSNCGEDATDDKMFNVGYMERPCKMATINTEEFIHRLNYVTLPRFDETGGELGFYASSYTGEFRQVLLRTGGYVGQRIDYLALGDSFTSGEGETDDSYYLNGTNDEYEKCHVSTRSYPYLVASLSAINPEFMRSVACSGAMTKDILGNDSLYYGQGNRLSKSGLSPIDIILAKNFARNYFIPGRALQNSFVQKYQPEIITVGIGGNDAGFMEILKTCVGPNTCDAVGTSQGKEQTAAEIKNLFGKLVDTYKKINLTSPNSKIYAIGYPKIIDPVGTCNLSLGYLLNDTEKQFMNEGIIYLNEVIAAAAKAVGIKYIDIQDSYGDQALCGKIQPSAMNSIVLGDDTNLVNDSRWFRFIGNEVFHPNSLGHYLVAGSIIGSVGNIKDYNYCENGAVICPDQTVVAPEPSTYWIPNGYNNYPKQQIANYVFDRADATDGRQKQLILDNNSLAPNSSATVEIASTPQLLGQFAANANGALNVSVDLPIDLEEGFHTVHLYGTSYSGEAVDLYQVIAYRKPYVEPEVQPQPIDDVVDVTTNPNDVNIANEEVSDSTVKINKNNVLAIDNDLNDGVINDQYPETIALVGEPMVKGASIVADKSFASTDELETKNNDNTPDYLVIGLFCVVIVTAVLLIIKRLLKANR